MAKKGKKRALEPTAQVKVEDTTQQDDGLTQLERERAAIIAHNRERLAALGIASLRAELEGGAAGGGGKPAKAKRAKQRKPRVKEEDGGGEEHATRRSTRLQDAHDRPKPEPETAEEQAERELGLAVVEGQCPRCGKVLERGHKRHLQSCTGAAAPRAARPPPHREAALEELSPEELRDAHTRLLARMKAIHLDGITELSAEAAKFAVLGSTGKHYTISLNDTKHSCTCLDFRFRRHNCKHICVVLEQLGVLEKPEEWRAAVDSRMDELVRQQRDLAAVKREEAPRAPAEEVGLKFL